MQDDGDRPTVVMLDYDGVLVDSFDYFHGAFVEACHAHGFTQVDGPEAFRRIFDVNMYDGLVAAGVPREAIGPILESMAAALAQNGGRYDFFEGIPQVLDRLAERAKLLVITSNLTANPERFLRGHGITCIEEVLGSDKGLSKVEKIRGVMQRHPAARHYYVGDTVGDIIEGREAGALTVGVSWGSRSTAASIRWRWPFAKPVPRPC